jgi:hypothetical protein
MPIEIRELHIKATVSDPAERQLPVENGADLKKIKQEIITECVEKVLDIIKKEKER